MEGENWRPQRDSNPRRRRERPVSWTGLDDGDCLWYLMQKENGEPRRIRTFDPRLKRALLYQLS